MCSIVTCPVLDGRFFSIILLDRKNDHVEAIRNEKLSRRVSRESRAPCNGTRLVVDGATNGEVFLAYVEQELVPTLRKGDIVVMDNLSSHNVTFVECAIGLLMT